MAKTGIKKKRNKEKGQLSLTPFMQYNAGDVEKNIKAFNHAMGQDKEQGEDVEMTQGEMTTGSEGGAGTGMGESMKSKSIYEELRNVADIDEKSREIANPDFASAVREIKKNNKARDKAGEIRKAPESSKEALPKDLKPVTESNQFIDWIITPTECISLIESEIAYLVKRYEAVQKNYNGDSEASKAIEGKIDTLEQRLNELKNNPTSERSKKICRAYAQENANLSESKQLKESIETITVERFPELYKGSWYTILGAGGALEDWEKSFQEICNKENIGQIKEFVTYTGDDMNSWGHLTGENAYPGNLTFVSFSLDGLDISKLAMIKLKMGDRWFDDIIDNNAREQGYHPMGEEYLDTDKGPAGDDIVESLDNVVDVEDKSKEAVQPDFAQAVRDIKKNDKARDEAGKVRKAPKESEEVLPKDLKMELDESLFKEAVKIPRNAKKIKVGDDYFFFDKDNELTRRENDSTTWEDKQGRLYDTKFIRNNASTIDVVETDPNYQPKRTQEVSVLQGKYAGYWEDIIEYTVDTPREEIRDDLKSYEENEPNYAHRLIRRRVPISESLVESAKVEITSFDMKPLGGGYPWYAYTVEFSDGTRYDGQAKVFYEPSFYGIYGGRVSKFTMKDLDGNLLANYDRGWDVKPKERAKMEKVVQKLDAQQEDEYVGDSNYKDVYAVLQGKRDSWEEIDYYDTEQEAQKEIEKMKSCPELKGNKYRIRKMKQPIDEKLENGEVDDYFNKAKKLGVKTLGDLQNLMKNDSETAIDGSDMQKMDNYYKKANPMNNDLSDDTLGNMSDDDIVRIILASCKGKPDNIFAGKNRENLIKRFAARYPEKSVEEWEKLVKTAMDCRFGVSK